MIFFGETSAILLSVYVYNIRVCVSLSSLEGTEEKLRNRESRPEDLHIIAELREMVTEREALVKKLVVGRAVEGGVFNLCRVCIIKKK